MKQLTCLAGALALAATLAVAQERRGPGGPPEGRESGPRPGAGMRMGRDPIMENLFPPQLVREAGDDIQLTEDQRKALREEMDRVEKEFAGLREKVKTEIEALDKLLKADKVDEAAAKAQSDKVMAAESEVKKAHLGLLIRIKNLLTPEQQAKLREWKKDHPPMRRPAEGLPDRPQRPDRGDRPPPPPDKD
jgi:Spy/CpxP family protein refolding chaperone